MASKNTEIKNLFQVVPKEDEMVRRLRDPMEIEGQSSYQYDERKK
jgi:hypothetical protein